METDLETLCASLVVDGAYIQLIRRRKKSHHLWSCRLVTSEGTGRGYAGSAVEAVLLASEDEKRNIAEQKKMRKQRELRAAQYRERKSRTVLK